MVSKDVILKLYKDNLMSVQTIADYLNIKRASLDKAFTYYGIPLRSKQDQSYLQHGKNFKIKTNMSLQDMHLYGLGIGLYWGEGNKTDPYSVRLGNTDASLIVLFVKFLKEICRIHDDDIRFGLQLFNDADQQKSLAYWMTMLNCTSDSFHKTISAIPPQGKGTYTRRNMHGVLQVYVSNKKFKEWMMSEVNKYAAIAQG